jgi:hypothetical protein
MRRRVSGGPLKGNPVEFYVGSRISFGKAAPELTLSEMVYVYSAVATSAVKEVLSHVKRNEIHTLIKLARDVIRLVREVLQLFC